MRPHTLTLLVLLAPLNAGCATFLEDPFLLDGQTTSTAAATGPEMSSAGAGSSEASTVPNSPTTGDTTSTSTGVAATGDGAGGAAAMPVEEDPVDFAAPDAGVGGAGGANRGTAGEAAGGGSGGASPSGGAGGTGGEASDADAWLADNCAGQQWQDECSETQLTLQLVDASTGWAGDTDAVIDGSGSTGVSAYGTKAWLEFELSSPAVLTQVRVAAAGTESLTWSLFYYDGDTLVPATEGVSAVDSAYAEVSLEGIVASRLRLVLDDPSGNGGGGTFGGTFGGMTGTGGNIEVTEVELFGIVPD